MNLHIAHSGAWGLAIIMIVVASWLFYRYFAPKGWHEWAICGVFGDIRNVRPYAFWTRRARVRILSRGRCLSQAIRLTLDLRVKRAAEVKLADVEERIAALVRMRDALSTLVSTCPGHGETADCPILKALGGEDCNEHS